MTTDSVWQKANVYMESYLLYWMKSDMGILIKKETLMLG